MRFNKNKIYEKKTKKMKRGLTRKFTFLKSRIFEENMTLKQNAENR
jgi:hypothetical protein